MDSKLATLRAEARERAAAVLRQVRGVEAAPEESRKPPEPPPQEEKPSEPASDPSQAQKALSQRVEAQLKQQQELVQAQLAEAQAAKAEADAKLQKLQRAAQNPVEFLEENGIDLDAWQARLLNGGEATAEEKSRMALEARLQKQEAELAEFKKVQVAQTQEAQTQNAVEALRGPLAEDFPLVNRFLGPEKALHHLREMQAQAGGTIDAKATIAELEKGFIEGLTATLQDKAIAAKIKFSPSTPVAEQVAIQGPRTITNSVTSSTAPHASGRTTLQQKREQARKLIAQMAR